MAGDPLLGRFLEPPRLEGPSASPPRGRFSVLKEAECVRRSVEWEID